MSDKKKKPEIRFQGFSDKWEEKKLGEIYNFQYGYFNNNPSDGGIYPVYGANGIIGSYSRFNSEDSVVIGHMGEYAGSVLWGEGKHFVTYNGIISLPKSHDIDPRYGYFMLLRLNIRKICGGSGQPFLSYETLQKLESVIPLVTKEQTQIGNFFQNLDTLLSLHQRKHDKLITVKKSMLEKMFPKDGADVPEIRFKAFSGKWEKRKIGEILTEKKESIKLEDNKIYELVTVKRRNGGVVSRGFLKGKDILVKNYFEVKAGDYIISKRQVIHGANGIVPQSLDNAIVSNEYLVAVGNENISTEFWAIISTLPEMYKKFFLSSYGVDIEKMVFNVEDWKKRIITIPKLTEQKRIIEFFQTLDQLISLQRREIEKLKSIKKGCLEKMFV